MIIDQVVNLRAQRRRRRRQLLLGRVKEYLERAAAVELDVSGIDLKDDSACRADLLWALRSVAKTHYHPMIAGMAKYSAEHFDELLSGALLMLEQK